MKTILRFFRPCEFECCEQYEGENLIAPQLNSVITLECDCDNVFRVDDIDYVYYEGNVMIDVELRHIEDGYWKKYDEHLHDDEFECNGECESCELNDAGMTKDESEETDELDSLINHLQTLFDEYDIHINIIKE